MKEQYNLNNFISNQTFSKKFEWVDEAIFAIGFVKD